MTRIFPILLFVGLAWGTIINIPADYSTIQEGIDNAQEADTILVANGIYTENISWRATYGIKLIGSDIEECIIDGNQNGSVIRFENIDSQNPDSLFIIDSSTIISNFTIRNGYAHGDGNLQHGGGISMIGNVKPKLRNLIIENNSAEWSAGGIYCYIGALNLADAIIRNNYAQHNGGGVYKDGGGDSLIIRNVQITGNSANYCGALFIQQGYRGSIVNTLISNNTSNAGGSIGLFNTGLDFKYCTIWGNSSPLGAIYINTFSSQISINNSILWENYPLQMYVNNADFGLSIDFSNIQSISENLVIIDNSNSEYGFENIYSNENHNGVVFLSNSGEIPFWGDYNINQHPLFCDLGSSNFSLAENSPSIGIDSTGNPYIMGAFDIGCSEILSNISTQKTSEFKLSNAYPNPFNPITTLKYELPKDSFVDVTVYDLLGNVVNNLGELVSAGVYLYKIQAGEFSQTKKMILLK